MGNSMQSILKEKYEENENGWKFVKSDKGSKVYKRSQKEFSQGLFLIESEFDLSYKDVFFFLFDKEKRMLWDQGVELQEVIQTEMETEERGIYLVRTKMKPHAGGIISAREYIDVVSYSKYDDSYLNYGATAVEIGKPIKCPKGFVRGTNGPGGYLASKISENKTKLQLVANTNINGWVPTSVINASLATALIDMMVNLKKALNNHKNNVNE